MSTIKIELKIKSLLTIKIKAVIWNRKYIMENKAGDLCEPVMVFKKC